MRYEDWLVYICALFPNLKRLSDVYRIYDYGSDNPDEKYRDLEWFRFSQVSGSGRGPGH